MFEVAKKNCPFFQIKAKVEAMGQKWKFGQTEQKAKVHI